MNTAQSELFGLQQKLAESKQFLQEKNDEDHNNDPLTLLISMGFDVNEAKFALKRCQNDIVQAIEILSDNFEENDIDGNSDIEQFEAKQEETFENDDDIDQDISALKISEIKSKLICFSCKTKWLLPNVEWYIHFKICHLCPDDSIRINFDSNRECWICPLCIHNAHKLCQSLTSNNDGFCRFKCGRSVSPGTYRSGNAYKTCCKKCALNKGELSVITHSEQCNQRKHNEKYNMNGLSLLFINKLSKDKILYLQYKQKQDETVKLFFIVFLGLCPGLNLKINT